MERLSLLPAAQEHILSNDREDGKSRFCRNVNDLSRAFALCHGNKKKDGKSLCLVGSLICHHETSLSPVGHPCEMQWFNESRGPRPI